MQGRENFTISIRAYRRTEATISARNFNREGEREGEGREGEYLRALFLVIHKAMEMNAA